MIYLLSIFVVVATKLAYEHSCFAVFIMEFKQIYLILSYIKV